MNEPWVFDDMAVVRDWYRVTIEAIRQVSEIPLVIHGISFFFFPSPLTPQMHSVMLNGIGYWLTSHTRMLWWTHTSIMHLILMILPVQHQIVIKTRSLLLTTLLVVMVPCWDSKLASVFQPLLVNGLFPFVFFLFIFLGVLQLMIVWESFEELIDRFNSTILVNARILKNDLEILGGNSNILTSSTSKHLLLKENLDGSSGPGNWVRSTNFFFFERNISVHGFTFCFFFVSFWPFV